MITAITARAPRRPVPPCRQGQQEFHSQIYSSRAAEARFRVRLLPLLFIALMAPLFSSFLPLQAERTMPAQEPQGDNPTQRRPESLPQQKPIHEPLQPEFRIALG